MGLKANRKFYDLQSYTLAGIPYPATGKGSNYTPGEQAHTLILGATGSGKTKVIQDLVSQIDKNNGKAVIIDIKGDYIKHFYRIARGDIILNPLDLRGSNWSFFKETNALTGFDTIAKILIPDGYGDSFWTNAARILFSELANLYKDRDLSIAEFAREVSTMKLGAMEKLLENTRASHLVSQKAEKTAICILMMLSIYLAPFKLYSKTQNVFSIREWVNDPSKNNFLFISTSPEVKGSLNPLVQMQVDLAVNALCSLKNDSNQKIWFILDELAYFDGGIQSLKDGLTISRSFGGAFVLGVQDLSSLSKIYGSDLSRVIANNCRNKFIMNVDDSYTSKWCSELFGEGEVEEWHEGFSYGAHQHRDGVNSNKTTQVKRTILPSQFSQLATGSGYMKLPGFYPALVKFQEIYLQSRIEPFIENPQLKHELTAEMKKIQNEEEKLKEQINKVEPNFKEEIEFKNLSVKGKQKEEFI